ncbi:putative bifunctional diguanylate cyclase/phosphodiesterase [Kineococcus rhizosphaerae]|uniref:Diguanylate cyclase (GGDEF)-like protein n=1 Tax=Kineococcus rhizosphaerae TaxID=559628 RepID=A0A2T0QYP2_9ACTN|nr:EAL domain-containing protein [Kineococcus rhizosphaerae]PRY11495.1 diguanylate cyclase (GGDEF)-like protein [Kineococcus rhizosphaerae]
MADLPEQRERRSISLRARLLALVLVPVLGFSAFASILVVHRFQRVQAAEDAVRQVRAAIALDAVRARVSEEAIPLVSSVELLDLSVAGGTLQARNELAVNLHTLYSGAAARTDAAVATASRNALAGPQVRDAATSLATVRASWGAGATADERLRSNRQLFDKYRFLVATLSDAVDEHLAAAAAGGGDPQLDDAVTELQRTARATTLAGEEVPYYLGYLAAENSIQGSARGFFLRSWAGYRNASDEVSTSRHFALRNSWGTAVLTADAQTVDGTLDEAAAATTRTVPDAETLVALSTAVVGRDDALHAALRVAADRAVGVAEGYRGAAEHELVKYAAITVLLLALSLGGSLYTSRSIGRPLERLADAAGSISRGELVDVTVEGPPETRVVAHGLGAAVASLRSMQAQAQAVADGDLDDAVLHRPLGGPLGRVVHASVQQIVTAVREREELQQELAHQATHDALTTLPNRAEALAQIDRALRRTHRTGDRVGLLFLDLDQFKTVNDSLGHVAGDAVLQTVAQRLRERVRAVDVVARLGGDEFVVLVEPVTDEKGLLEFGQALIDTVSAPIPLLGSAESQAVIGASVGVAVSRVEAAPGAGGHEAADRLLQEAHTAAYRAKNAGRGRVEVYDDDLRAALAAQTAVEDGLRHALVADELVLHYQPVTDLETGRVRSVEALVRWEKPGEGLVPPGRFIPVAEGSDLVCDLGRWALRTSLRQLAEFDATGGPAAGLSVAVNISGRHLRSPRLVEDVRTALEASGTAPGRLVLEVTETVMVEDDAAWARLEELRAIGVRVAIDDFGTGYTSFGQLARVPVDVLKIDRSFVDSDDPRTVELVRLVVGAARSFGLRVVAEGTEQASQVRALQAVGCDTAQGYYFSRPVPAGRLAEAVTGCGEIFSTLGRFAEAG